MSNVTKLDTYHFYEEEWESYEQLCAEFEWDIPDQFNMAEYVCDRWADDKSRVALFAETANGDRSTYTFWQIRNRSNQLANYLQERDIGRGDRVIVTGNQRPLALIAAVAAWKLGAVFVPVSGLIGSAGLRYRMADSGASAFVTGESNVDTFRDIKDEVSSIDFALTADVVDRDPDEYDLWEALQSAPRAFDSVATDADDMATIIYTSGTTGDPKGVVFPHSVLLGHLPGFITGHCNMELREDDVFWIPAEWSWIGLYPAVLCPWFYGRPTVGFARDQFDPEDVFRIVETYETTYFGASPTTYRMMMGVDDDVSDRYDVSSIRITWLSGEQSESEITEWISAVFDEPAIHELYGQTEVNILAADCTALGKRRPDAIGVPTPGHEVAIVDPDTAEPTVEEGTVGEIAARHDSHPICFEEYWNKPERTAEKVTNGWLLTEDLGRMDDEGYVYFESRKDDVIISSGYRLGPEAIEGSLTAHEAVADAGVIGVPHDVRGEVPKAFVELQPGFDPSDELKTELQRFVKDSLAKYEYPREIAFIDELPKTRSEKVRRVDLREREGLTE